MMPYSFIRATERRELICDAVEWAAAGRHIAMVTLVNVEGNSPYPIGSQMLVNECGDYLGQITGGCAEQAIAEHAVAAITAKQNTLQRYGLGSPYFDIQLPCGSGIDVLIDVSTDLAGYQAIHDELLARRSVKQPLEAAAQAFYKRYYPNQRLILLGQGPILLNTANIALASGFDVLCVAQNDATVELLKKANVVAVKLPSNGDLSTIRKVCDPFAGLVSLFHEHDFEADILQAVLDTELFYIGALGSKKTHAARLELLQAQGVSEPNLQRIRGPVGVNINAKTPAQIAISIVAQAIDELNQYLQLGLSDEKGR